jgi:hypothetical protein
MTDVSYTGAVVLRPSRNLWGRFLTWLLGFADREVSLTRRYQKMMAGGNRSTPSAVLKNGNHYEVVSPPTRMDPHWELVGGVRVTTDEIKHFDYTRGLIGQSY